MEEDKSFMVAAAVQSNCGDTLLRMLSCENGGNSITPLDVWKLLKAARERACKLVLLFSKLNKIFFGFFEPENIFFDNKNK